MTFETVTSKLAELEEYGKQSLWAKADIVRQAVDVFGPGVIGQIADVLSCSKPHVKLMCRMSEVFNEEVRYPDTPWGIYLLCADTDNPQEWLQKAVDNRWSIKELKEALKALKEKDTPQQEAMKLANKLAARLAFIASIDAEDKVFADVSAVLANYMTVGDAYEHDFASGS
jgi:hypothetical protein